MVQLLSTVSTPRERADRVTAWLDQIDRVPMLSQLARSLGVNSLVRTDGVPDAAIARNGKGFVMYLNPDQRGTRQKFSVAHELAHLMIDANLATAKRSSLTETASDTDIERHCDEIATRMLMPRRVFTKAMRDFETSLDGIKGLARHFGTSMHATSIRYSALNRKQFAVLRAEPSPETSRLAVKWSTVSISVRPRRKIPVGKDVDHISTLRRAFESNGRYTSLAREYVRLGPFDKTCWVEARATYERPGVLALISRRRIRPLH